MPLATQKKKNSRVIPSYYTPRIQAEEALAQTPLYPKPWKKWEQKQMQENTKR